MRLIVLLIAGVALWAFGAYLAILLGAIRRSGYGEGKLLELPGGKLSFRYPGWWTLARSERPRPRDGVDLPAVRLRTGHGRGVVTLERLDTDEGPSTEGPQQLKPALLGILERRGILLDETEVRTVPAGPPEAPSGWRASVASAGREGPNREERSYLELHLVQVGEARFLVSYTNAVLLGFMDAYYLERMMETIREPGGPG